jgi:hypothetical protein
LMQDGVYLPKPKLYNNIITAGFKSVTASL